MGTSGVCVWKVLGLWFWVGGRGGSWSDADVRRQQLHILESLTDSSSATPELYDLGRLTWPLCAQVPHKLRLVIVPTSLPPKAIAETLGLYT